jgi:bifunctional non-homologous end joining protein LigD
MQGAHARLEAYAAKRDFDKTPEPAPDSGAARGARRFVVQKHAARQVHYDFRLEMDGVLASWAVARGPSLDPAQKRLAVRTEDHPISYRDFEGTIPKGSYGAGTVMIWDAGTWEPIGDARQGFEKGDLKFRLHGDRLRGDWVLVRMRRKRGEKRENWLLIKKKDAVANTSIDPVKRWTTSVETGRTIREIGNGKAASAKEDKMPDEGSRRRSARRSEDSTELAGIRLTHPDKVLFPDAGITKQDLAAYYVAVADRLLPHLAKRPISLVRCPEGRNAECFFQKHRTKGMPAALHAVPVKEKSGKSKDYLAVDDVAGLVAGAQFGALEFHMWGARSDRIERPDRLVFDLDPGEEVAFAQVCAAAAELRGIAESAGLAAFALLTGGKGIHVVLPLVRRHNWDAVSSFSRDVAQALAKAEPKRYVAKSSLADRGGRIFIDWMRNQRGSTAIAPYSPRARQGAPVAVPVTWDELPDMAKANCFNMAEAQARATGASDPWEGYFDAAQVLRKAVRQGIAEFVI